MVKTYFLKFKNLETGRRFKMPDLNTSLGTFILNLTKPLQQAHIGAQMHLAGQVDLEPTAKTANATTFPTATLNSLRFEQTHPFVTKVFLHDNLAKVYISQDHVTKSMLHVKSWLHHAKQVKMAHLVNPGHDSVYAFMFAVPEERDLTRVQSHTATKPWKSTQAQSQPLFATSDPLPEVTVTDDAEFTKFSTHCRIPRLGIRDNFGVVSQEISKNGLIVSVENRQYGKVEFQRILGVEFEPTTENTRMEFLMCFRGEIKVTDEVTFHIFLGTHEENRGMSEEYQNLVIYEIHVQRFKS